MTDIVERLRSPANVFYEYAADNGAFLREAADEIEWLRKENQELKLQYLSDQGQWIEETERLREALSEYACGCTTRLCPLSVHECGWVARAALGEKE